MAVNFSASPAAQRVQTAPANRAKTVGKAPNVTFSGDSVRFSGNNNKEAPQNKANPFLKGLKYAGLGIFLSPLAALMGLLLPLPGPNLLVGCAALPLTPILMFAYGYSKAKMQNALANRGKSA